MKAVLSLVGGGGKIVRDNSEKSSQSLLRCLSTNLVNKRDAEKFSLERS